jgi:1-acyl-sn-glycerol-3-phosphate acyltransferase/DNA-directed RNA polymerase subunit RPC12/RpoP
MKPSKADIRKDMVLKILKPLVHLWMHFDMKTTYIYNDGFDPKREEPYILLSNHTFMFDVVHVPLPLKKTPFIVASHNLFVKQPTKFLLSKIAHAIPKTKNASDLRTAKELIKAVKRGYPICIFPEGNTTFTGETTYIEESTMKLIKKLGIDVVTIRVRGGYLSKPRWALGKRKNRQALITYNVAIHKEQINDLTIEDIGKIVNRKLYNNDYAYQKEAMIPHPGKKLAEGIENILYVCPECESIATLQTEGNTISCSHCKTKGLMDEYGFIQGFQFDNPIDWDHFQRKFDTKLKNVLLESPCVIQVLNHKTLKYKTIGKGVVSIHNGIISITGAIDLKVHVKDISHPHVTLRRDFNLIIDDVHYLIKIEQYVIAFLRSVQSKY